MKTLTSLFATLLISSCVREVPNGTRMEDTHAQSGRFDVQRVSQFRDDLAYDKWRGIYIIKDSKTGKEFVGISGIGISELGRHQAGEIAVSDER